jgi:nitrite reductase (NADH) small subunit
VRHTGRHDSRVRGTCGTLGDGEKDQEGDGRMPGFVKLATLDELPPGRGIEVEHDGRIYALFNVGGVISAIDGVCPHQGGPLADGAIEGTCVTCPWHGWQFDVRTGKTPLGPRIKQAVYEVKVEGRDVFVSVA